MTIEHHPGIAQGPLGSERPWAGGGSVQGRRAWSTRPTWEASFILVEETFLISEWAWAKRFPTEFAHWGQSV